MYEKLIRRQSAGSNTSIWRTVCCVLFVLLVAQNLRLLHSSIKPAKAIGPNTPLPVTGDEPSALEVTNPWYFNSTRDANNFALSLEQCDAAFPDLYKEIDRAVSLRKEQLGPIEVNHTSLDWREDGVFRALIHNNKLHILETRKVLENKGFRERTHAVLQQINRALIGASAAGETLPTIEFSVIVEDRPNLPTGANDSHVVWSFCRRLADRSHDRAWIIPDFNFWSWLGVSGDFAEYRDLAAQRDAFVADKVPQAVWRGVTWTNPSVRGPLIKVSKKKSWADVAEIDWKDGKNMMPIEDFCRYAFVVHTEGRSWSGRLKYMLQCDSVAIVHKMEWLGSYYHLLNGKGKDQNVITVNRDFSNLEKKVKHYLSHPEEAQRISDNSRKVFRDRYLTPAAQACYWRRMIRGWSEVAFQPEIYEDVKVDVSGWNETETKLRGISFEEFIIGSDEYPPIPEE